MAAECHTDTVTWHWGRARTRRLGVGPARACQTPGRTADSGCRSTLKFKFKLAAAQHAILRNLQNSETNLNCQPGPPARLLNSSWIGCQWPTSSFLPVHPMAGTVTDSICAVPIRRWNGWRICPTCPVPGPRPSDSESACQCCT